MFENLTLPERLTDTHGRMISTVLLGDPLPLGSVVMVEGLAGYAYQKDSNGRWQGAWNSRSESDLLSLPDVYLIHVPPMGG